MAKEKTFKQFRKDGRKCKTGKRGRRNAGNHTSQTGQEVPKQEQGTRIGGRTTHVLPEPRGNEMEKSIIRIDTPPEPENDY